MTYRFTNKDGKLENRKKWIPRIMQEFFHQHLSTVKRYGSTGNKAASPTGAVLISWFNSWLTLCCLNPPCLDGMLAKWDKNGYGWFEFTKGKVWRREGERLVTLLKTVLNPTCLFKNFRKRSLSKSWKIDSWQKASRGCEPNFFENFRHPFSLVKAGARNQPIRKWNLHRYAMDFLPMSWGNFVCFPSDAGPFLLENQD